MPHAPIPAPALEAFFLAFWDAWRGVGRTLEAELERELSLDLRAYLTLAVVNDQPPEACQPALLAELLGVPRYEMSRVLAGLEKQGLIVRQESARDARRVEVSLTPEGLEATRAALAVAHRVTQPVLSPLGTPAIEHMTAQLRQVAQLVQAAPPVPVT